MSSDTLLSDVEDDEPPPPIDISTSLDQERQARKAAQKSTSELQTLLEHALRAKESSRSQMESAAKILVSGIDDISMRLHNYTNFGEGGLPRSDKHCTGLPGVAYGVITRMEQILELLLPQDGDPKMEVQRSLVGRIHKHMHEVIKVLDFGQESEMSESLFVAPGTDVESIYVLSRLIMEKTRDLVDRNKGEVKRLNESVAHLVKEKEQVGSLLRTAMSRGMSGAFSSMTNDFCKVAENGMREARIHYGFSDYIDEDKNHDSEGVASTTDPEDNEVYALAGALENIITHSQLEIVELKHTVEELRKESSLLKEQLATQAKELTQHKLRVEELEERERVSNENVEGLMLDITAAEEEITRWKVAAQEEAAAGKAVEEEYTEQLAAAHLELEEANQAVIQGEKKLKFKEETAVAAVAARDAAEKSLRLADMRSTRLKAKVVELGHQLQERGSGETSRTFFTRPRYMCWPWEWLGLDFVGCHKQPESQQESANEMELSEPLL